MKAELKLVSTSGSVVQPTLFPSRPIKTFYYGSDRSAWSHRGSAATPQNAVKAALRQMLDGRCELAVVEGASGEVVARVWRTAKGISIVGV